VPYYHLVFTLPAAIGAIAYQNKAAVYDLLFRASAETLTTIAADPRHLGARIGITAVLHTWGSALTHHPHIHAVVPDGFHRIRHYGLFASAVRAANIERVRALLVDQQVRASPEGATPAETIRPEATLRCRCCAGIMIIIETFARGSAPKTWPASASIRIDTS